MRVITGTAKGRNLETPAGPNTRPTSGVVKEAMFSAIQFEIQNANVLDLFAGSGQMGIEALSRGAKSCVFVDNSRAAQSAIKENLDKTGLRAHARLAALDANVFLRSASGPYDIAFLDPPYAQGLIQATLSRVAAVMRTTGVILCETDKAEPLPDTAGEFTLFKNYRYGKTKVTVYRNPTAWEE